MTKSDNDKQKISTVRHPLQCKQEGCSEWALSLSKYCWKHMAKKEKEKYKEKIEYWRWKYNNSLEGFILSGANLSGARLEGANLSNAVLMETNLSGAWFLEANLHGATLIYANLKKALLTGANCTGAVFTHANLTEAVLNGAILNNAFVRWTNLNNVKGLRISNFSKRLTKTEKEESKARGYSESYLFVKNYLLRMGLYDDASEAAYREKVLNIIYDIKKIKKSILVNTLIEIILSITDPFLNIIYLLIEPFSQLFNNIKRYIKTIFNLVWLALCGYGEKPFRVVFSSSLIILAYSLYYWLKGALYPSQNFSGSLYFSIVTFTTLGYGDIHPLRGITRFVASSEAFIGAFMIALFVWTLARRGAAR